MSYKKQNFKNGEKLDANMLNHIEDGILSLEKALSKQKVKKVVLFKDNDLIVGGELVLTNGKVPIEVFDLEPAE